MLLIKIFVGTIIILSHLINNLHADDTSIATATNTNTDVIIKDKPKSKILITPWGAYRQSSKTAEVMKTQFRNFGATKVIQTPVFKQTNILHKYSHDSIAKTQGLALDDTYPYIIEVTGGKFFKTSSIRRVNFLTGEIASSRMFPNKGLYSYGGLGIVGNSIYIGTRNTNTIFVYDKKTFAPKKIVGRADNTFLLPRIGAAEVKGLTSNNFDKIYITDGSSNIYVYDNFMAYKETIQVKDGTTYVRDLNAISYVNGILYVNINGKNSIAKILPETGDIIAWLVFDVQSLYPDNPNPWRNFLNGIAYNSFNSTFIFSGLNWPYMYEMKENHVNPMKNITKKWIEDNCWSDRKAYRAALSKYENLGRKRIINIPHDQLTKYREDREHATDAFNAHASQHTPNFADALKNWNVEDHRFYDYNGMQLRPGILKYTPGGYYNKHPERRPTYEGVRGLRNRHRRL